MRDIDVGYHQTCTAVSFQLYLQHIFLVIFSILGHGNNYDASNLDFLSRPPYTRKQYPITSHSNWLKQMSEKCWGEFKPDICCRVLPRLWLAQSLCSKVDISSRIEYSTVSIFFNCKIQMPKPLSWYGDSGLTEYSNPHVMYRLVKNRHSPHKGNEDAKRTPNGLAQSQSCALNSYYGRNSIHHLRNWQNYFLNALVASGAGLTSHHLKCL